MQDFVQMPATRRTVAKPKRFVNKNEAYERRKRQREHEQANEGRQLATNTYSRRHREHPNERFVAQSNAGRLMLGGVRADKFAVESFSFSGYPLDTNKSLRESSMRMQDPMPRKLSSEMRG